MVAAGTGGRALGGQSACAVVTGETGTVTARPVGAMTVQVMFAQFHQPVDVLLAVLVQQHLYACRGDCKRFNRR